MIYLASPYTDPDPEVMFQRYRQAEETTAAYIFDGYPIFSPIVHCHHMAERFAMPKDFAFWQAYNRQMLRAAHSLYVLRLPGWSTSSGVQGEIDQANFHRKHIIHILPRTLP